MTWRSIGGQLLLIAEYSERLWEIEQDLRIDISYRRMAGDLLMAFAVAYRTLCRAAGVRL